MYGPVAQLVEQRIENPRVGGSIPPQATIIQINGLREGAVRFFMHVTLRPSAWLYDGRV